MIVEAVLTLVLVYLVHYAITTYLMRRKMPPGPIPYPLLGNFPHLLCDPIAPFEKLADKYGNIFTLSFPNGDITVVLNTASLLREARLGTGNTLAGKNARTLYPWNEIFGDDLISADFSPEWQFRRKTFKAAMHVYGAGIEQATELAGHAVNIVLKEIDLKEGNAWSPAEYIESAIIVQLWEWVTSEKLDLNDPIVKTMLKFDKILQKQALLAAFHQVIPFLKYLPTEGNREIKEAREILKSLFPRRFIAHKETYRAGIIRDLTDSFICCYENEIAKETDKRIGSTDDIAGLMADVIFAGASTISMSLSYFFLYMIAYKDVQEKIHMELDSVLGRDRLPSWNDVKDMPYLQATLCEVQRASGFILVTGTTSIQDMTIAGYHIPKDTLVAFNLARLHKDPQEWSEPEKFKPERFLDSDGKFVGWNKLHGFVPFGVGRRECPGQTMAKIMMFTFSSVLLQRYQFELPEGDEVPTTEQREPGINKRANPYKVITRKRD